ncbi:MAG: type III pantothenate kinase [Phycisphaerae bacterium]|nr:type III pantothenate kinase [Phycisphaerae bacterium]
MIAERDDHSKLPHKCCDHSHEHEHGYEHNDVPSFDASQLDSAANLILISVGNTRVTMAAYVDDKRAASHSVAINGSSVALNGPAAAISDVVTEIDRVWKSLPASQSRAVVITSVNPPVCEAIRNACDERKIGPVLVIGQELDVPMATDVLEPEKVGTDRLCVAAAAFAKIKGACVVADFGTAVTIDLVADNGIFLGGTILPGMALSARALHEFTASLPLVDVGRPTEVLGKDTNSAIRNGIFSMMIGALREITERYATDIGKWPPLVVTGGDAEAIAAGCDFVDRVAPDLVLDGLVIAWQNAFQTPES